MKRFLSKISMVFSIMLIAALAACSYPAGGTNPPAAVPTTAATLSGEQVQTETARLLTALPTSTIQQVLPVTPTAQLPTLAVETATPTLAVPTDTPAAATETLAPAVDVTATTAATASTEAAAAAATTAATATITPTAAPTATPGGPTPTLASGDPRTRLGAPASTDPMNDENFWIWPTGSDKYTLGQFSNGSQKITALTTTDGWRLANPTGHEFTNLYLEATFNTGNCAGADHYGLYFHVPDLRNSTQGYMFAFTCDGRYSLRRWNGELKPKGEMKWLVDAKAYDWKKDDKGYIATGANKTNKMGVMMVGSRIILYANGNLLTEAQDNTYPAGYFGVLLGSRDSSKNYTIQVDEMSYWNNPQP